MPKASKKTRKAAPVQDVEVEETEDSGTDSLSKVLNPTSVRSNITAFVDWVESQGGPKINAKHAQIVLTGYKKFQKSEEAVSAREAAAAEREEAKAARVAAREEKAKEREAAAAERAERRAEREKAKAAKAEKGKKSAAAASKPKGKKAAAAKPTPTAKAGKATAKTAAKKKSAKKAAF